MGDASWIPMIFSVWVAIAVLVFLSLFWITAPYGRHERSGWGITISSRVGWVLMEAPSIVGIVVLYWLSGNRSLFPTVAMLLWAGHYTYRTFIYPALARLSGKTMPLSVALMAIVFNLGNAGFNGMVLFFWMPVDGTAFLTAPHFVVGFALFVVGFVIHVHSDHVLRTLRAPGETGYTIPNRGLHQWVSSPNYFGETLQWTGFALLTWNLAGVSFAIWTAANLIPRALSNRRWYQEKFEDYPPERKAFIPFLL